MPRRGGSVLHRSAVTRGGASSVSRRKDQRSLAQDTNQCGPDWDAVQAEAIDVSHLTRPFKNGGESGVGSEEHDGNRKAGGTAVTFFGGQLSACRCASD
jgi:hypothetical protein